jgi:hypothetical protein
LQILQPAEVVVPNRLSLSPFTFPIVDWIVLRLIQSKKFLDFVK